MQPSDEGAGRRQAQEAPLPPEQERPGRMARVVGAAVGGKVHGRRRAEVDLEALLLENRLGVRALAVATRPIRLRPDAERPLDLPGQRRELGGLEFARQIARVGVRPIHRLAMRRSCPGIEVRPDRRPAGHDVWLKRPESRLLRDNRIAQQIARDHAQRSRTRPGRGGSPPCERPRYERDRTAPTSRTPLPCRPRCTEQAAPFGAARNADATRGAHRPDRCATRPPSKGLPQYHGRDAAIAMTTLLRRSGEVVVSGEGQSVQPRPAPKWGHSGSGDVEAVKSDRVVAEQPPALVVGDIGDRPVDHVDPRHRSDGSAPKPASRCRTSRDQSRIARSSGRCRGGAARGSSSRGRLR